MGFLASSTHWSQFEPIPSALLEICRSGLLLKVSVRDAEIFGFCSEFRSSTAKETIFTVLQFCRTAKENTVSVLQICRMVFMGTGAGATQALCRTCDMCKTMGCALEAWIF